MTTITPASPNTAKWVRGSDLPLIVQAHAKAHYVNRYTGQHVPAWAKPKPDGRTYPLQFKDDADWLANTWFAVTAAGFLDRHVEHCFSNPTWPDRPDLRPIVRGPQAMRGPEGSLTQGVA